LLLRERDKGLMMPIRRTYLTIFAILFVGSVFLFITKRLTDESKTGSNPEIKQAISSKHEESNPVGIGNSTNSNGDGNQKKISTTSGIGRTVDWNKYPGTLDGQIHRALDNHDGEMAMDVADKLWECNVAAMLLNPSEPWQSPSQDTTIQAARLERIQKYQRIDADCQTIAGDREQWRLRLLDVAIEKKVVGAAINSFNQGVRRPDVLQSVVRDAQAGDINSLTNMAYHKAADFEISADTQRAIRYALEVASNDPDVGKMVRPYLDIAETTSVPVGGETSAKFDNSNLSDEVRNEGKAIAEHIVSRINRGHQ